ncbi:MAG: bifunctional oligoribonuclease/PAP phosphatase NrnA [Bacteroidales bacterium]|nr:bifunctional oligoribonuclease/PAP phosphatase NrnA [Bacteroidales bacterium]
MADLLKYTKEFVELLESSDNILLISHINPDGDAIGSQIALYRYLVYKGKKVEMMCPNNLQEFLKWMDGSELINVFIKDRKKCKKLISDSGMIIMVDFNQPGRLGEAEEYVTSSDAVKVIIDHHLGSHDFASHLIIDSSRCSTSELIYELVMAMEGSPFSNRSFAEAVYVGIVTDTGNFEHGSYTGRTLKITADLIDSGIDRGRILNAVYNNFSSARMRLLGYALHQKLVILDEYSTAYISLTRKELSDFHHVKGDTEGFVNMPLTIKGINFAVLFIEKDNFVKISFRSKGNFAVNEFASRYFNGGGHLNASGGEYYDTLENTIAYFCKVLVEIEKHPGFSV